LAAAQKMTFKNSWLWIIVAIALLGASVWHYEHSRHPKAVPRTILSHISVPLVTTVQVRAGTELQIRAERTNGAWVLAEPVAYPADSKKVDGLLSTLEKLTPGIYITRSELLTRTNAEEEYGFGSPQATIILKQGDYRAQLFVGARTAPGDQVFLQVVGDDGIYVVDAGLLQFIPKKPDDWRATELLNLNGVAFDRITITNSGKGFELRKEETNRWRIFTSDFAPRAEKTKIDELLTNIMALRVQQFVSDAARADPDAFGLQNPEFQFGVAQGTNLLCTVQFGKSQTNDPALVFARNPALNTIVVVNRANLTPWPTMSSFRDPHLLGGVGPLENIEVRGYDNFSLVHQTDDTWKVLPQGFTADSVSVTDLLRLLREMRIIEFVKDVVPAQPQLLADYGLDHPVLEYTLHHGETNASSQPVQLQFSAPKAGKVLVRRADEPSVYAVKVDDSRLLATASWQLLNRRIWKYSINDLAGVLVQQHGTNFEILRKGDHQWSLASGLKGAIEPLAIEETMLDLVDLQAAAWLARGTNDLPKLGFSSDDQQITLQFKNAEKRTLRFSQNTPSTFGVVAVTLEGETRIFAIPPSLRRDIMNYLSIPAPAL
jgi:hypothetical protein